MNPRYLRGVLTPNQGYVCIQCRLDRAIFQVGGTRRLQQTSSRSVKNAPLLVLADKTLGQTTLESDLVRSPKKSHDTSSVGREDITKKPGNIVTRTSNVGACGIRNLLPLNSNILSQHFNGQKLT